METRECKSGLDDAREVERICLGPPVGVVIINPPPTDFVACNMPEGAFKDALDAQTSV